MLNPFRPGSDYFARMQASARHSLSLAAALRFWARHRRSLAGHHAAFGALGVRILAAGLAYLLQIILARSLGAEDYGTFSFAWSLVAVAGFLAPLGYAQIAVRFLARYHARAETGLAQGFMRQALSATLLGSLGAIFALIVSFPLIEQGYGTLCSSILVIGLFALPAFALTDLCEGLARSQGWTVRALLPPYLVRQGGLILLLFAAIFAGAKLDAKTAMLAALAATILAAFVHVLLLWRPLRAAFPAAPPEFARSEWRAAARPTLLADLALLARQNIDLLLLGLLAPAASVGVYFAATRIASLLGLIDFAISSAFGHRLARAQAGGDPAEFAAIFAAARRLSFLPGLAAASLLMLLAPSILALFGQDFIAALPATIVLLVAGAARLALGPVEDALTMSGFPDAVLRANLLGAAFMITPILCLAPSLGATGAAIGAAGGALATAAALTFALRRHVGFFPGAAGRLRPAEPCA